MWNFPIILLLLSCARIAFSSDVVEKPYSNEQLPLLASKVKLEWGGIGKNYKKSASDIADINTIASEDTLTIGLNSDLADCDLEGDFFEQQGFLKKYPSFSEIFKDKFSEIKIGHIGRNIFHGFTAYKQCSDPFFRARKDDHASLPVTPIINELKPMIDTLAVNGKFIYQSFTYSFSEFKLISKIPHRFMPTQQFLGSNSILIHFKPLLVDDDHVFARYETPVDVTDELSDCPSLINSYRELFLGLGLNDFKAEIVVVSKPSRSALSELELRKAAIGREAYLQVTGIKK